MLTAWEFTDLSAYGGIFVVMVMVMDWNLLFALFLASTVGNFRPCNPAPFLRGIFPPSVY